VAVDAFQSGKAAVLVATEIAARGLDLRRVRTVVNYAHGVDNTVCLVADCWVAEQSRPIPPPPPNLNRS